MEINGKRAFELLEKIGYVRVSGTPEEKRAADTLLEAAKSTGAEAWLEPFTVASGVVTKATLKVLEPYEAEYEVNGYLRSLPCENLVGDFIYAENVTDIMLEKIKDKFVLINGRVIYDLYEKLIKAGVKGVLTWTGGVHDDPEKTDLGINMLRPMLTDAFGDMIAVNMRATSAQDMVLRKASKICLTVESEKIEKTSHNVCAVVPGTEKPEEIVSLGGHFDSVHFSTGVYDNGSGSVVLMELLRHFAAHPAKRTLKFMWYGSEEQGLLGSKHHVAEMDKDEIEKTALMINVDVAGPILGQENAIVTGTEQLMDYVDSMMKEAGLSVVVTRDIYSSDSIPFADNGVPGVNFGRFGAPGGAYIHDRNDTIDFISGDALASTIEVVGLFTDRFANASYLPVKKQIPEDIVEKVNNYLKKKPAK